MVGTTRFVAAFVLVCATACGTGDTKVDPGDLELRDLLGVAPEVATTWDAEQRASARRVLVGSLDDEADPIKIELVNGKTIDEQVTRTLATIDARRFANGDSALGVVRIELAPPQLTANVRHAPALAAAAAGEVPPPIALTLDEKWGSLPPKSLDVLGALAIDAGHTGGALEVSPAPRLAVIAGYIAAPGAGDKPRLVVNPVLVAAIDPAFVAMTTETKRQAAIATDDQRIGTQPKAVAAGNPYSFYGSVAECAYAQRLRCESCLASSNCEPVTSTTDGNAECNTLAMNDGRGYFLLCINLSLAITSVDECTADAVSGCARNTEVANDLGMLDANANFLDDLACSAGLDGCLAKIYGEPRNPFPGIVDGGVTPPPEPPRETNVSCGDSCDNDKSSNCEASPNCDCSGPSCNNSFSCDSTCSSSNSQSGCGDNCDSCGSSSGGGGGGGCSSGSGGSSGGDSCGSCDSGGSSGGGSCGSCDSGGSSGGGSCGDCGGSSGGGSCGGSSGGGSCGGGSGGCQVTKKAPSAAFALGLSLSWALLPIPVAAMIKRRSRKRKKAALVDGDDASKLGPKTDDASKEVQS